MAKKTAAKKPKRRLKKTVRRSMAAVLMITAIVVAAIPVPENRAEDGASDVSTDVQSGLTYVPASRENGGYLDNPNGEHHINVGGRDCCDIDLDLSSGSGLPAELIKALDMRQLQATVKSIKKENRIELTWEFLYHANYNGDGPVLCKYNNREPSKVQIDDWLRLSYQTVSTEQIEAYFSEDPAANYTDTEDNPMDNLSKRHQLYPNGKIIYGIDTASKIEAETSEQGKFLRTYCKQQYEEQRAAIAAWKSGQSNTLPEDLVVIPREVLTSIDDKLQFYCEHNEVLNGFADTTFKLVEAADRTVQPDGTIGTGDTVYVAERVSGTKSNLGGVGFYTETITKNIDFIVDDNGILARTNKSVKLEKIGERAFYNVTNVTEIVISPYLNSIVIGDRAFEKSRIKNIRLDNHVRVGNGTFRECPDLESVVFGETSGTAQIGAEAFYGCPKLKSITFPAQITMIGHGAFAKCEALTTVDFSAINDTGGCKLGDYAFFDDRSLADGGLIFGDSTVNTLGKACFALSDMSANTAMTKFEFPKRATTIGEYVLANREKLTEVRMPDEYSGLVPSTTFYNCINLREVTFPNGCGDAYFKPDLFAHVTNENFFVRGPELYNNSPSKPRTSTWKAKTRVSGENGVPYVYVKDGKECYEVAMRSGDNIYRYEIDADGTLKSCVLEEKGKDRIDIVIPKKIGNYAVRSIGKDCFADTYLRDNIRSITIQDESITVIGDEAFAGLTKLERVWIGNSVAKIGERAFADCNGLHDVYFNTPLAGYGKDNFQMAESAFQTGGGYLTFHGDIVKNYAPFEYAMNPDHVLKDPKDDNEQPVNVCYQSLWNSKAEGTHLTVMVDRREPESGQTHDVVLLDYPKLTDLSEAGVLQDAELKAYCQDMERYYYDKVYDIDNNSVNSKGKTVGELRREYARLLDATLHGLTMADLDGDGKVFETPVTNDEFEKRYGPWINERFLETDEEGHSNWANWLGATETASVSDSGIRMAGKELYDFFFEPLTVKAAEPTPGVSIEKWLSKPYFKTYPYNFMKNYWLTKSDGPETIRDDYQLVGNASNFISGTETIVVPEGVTSIDVTSYANQAVNAENYFNYMKYINKSGNELTNLRNTSKTGNSVPGLFSGRFEDYRDVPGDYKDPSLEKEIRGNDVVKSIVLRSVKKLPAYAFDNCEQLKSVELGAVSEIGDTRYPGIELPFRGCYNLTELIGNEKYPVEKGVLFERKSDGKYKVVECLMSKGRAGTNDSGLEEKTVGAAQISMLKNVDEIAESAFEGCDNIVTVDFKELNLLKEIPEGCFNDCSRLMDVILPVSVNKIRERAFEDVTQSDGKKPLTVTIWGREVDIADNAFSPKNGVIIKSYLDSAAKRYADRYNPPIEFRELGAYSVKYYDYDGSLIGQQEYEKRNDVAVYSREPEEAQKLYETNHRPGYTFKGEWLGSDSKRTGIKIGEKLEDDLTTFIAQYESNGGGGGISPDGKYKVEFKDGLSGIVFRTYEIDAGMSFAEREIPAPEHPEHKGYEPYGFSDNWTVNTVIDRGCTIVALYRAVTTSGGSTNTSGGTTNTSKNTTSGNSGNTSGNSSNTSSSSSSTSSTSSSSTSSTSTTSGTSGAGQYTVFVENGSGSGTYTPGATVVIQASIPAAGMRFDKWTTESNGVTLASVSMTATTFTMPSNNVTVKANYVADNTTATSTTGTGNTTDTTGNGNTRVDIEKPGISNRDLATATTNGSTDNFIVKISETDEATRAVAAALTNKYGTLDNILYYAMDISLYDSTGTTKITDTTGLSVDITIPIPDSLVAYGGNNMAGAVINGDQLESLNESFTTINGVPCIRFRATHFSPYTIYVDTGNLVEGMLDVTPKTGDPIHPKWFLALGLACLSMILFLKRDKKVVVKA